MDNDEFTDLTAELEVMSTSPLAVTVDVMDLLDHFENDEQKVFDFLGNLRDLLG